jgi:prostatic aicd phosphatase
MLILLVFFFIAARLAVVRTNLVETVRGSVIFSRHGDRLWKGYSPTKLTAKGQDEMLKSGKYWRSRYLVSSSKHQILGINESTYDPVHLYAITPDIPILVMSGQAFLQGLYPLQDSNMEKLSDGSAVRAPLVGYQYPALHTITSDSPQIIWLRGDDACPAYDDASERVEDTSGYKSIERGSRDFYMSFYRKIFAGVLPQSDMTYHSAYNIYDYVNTGVVHNETIAKAVSPFQLYELRTLADSSEWSRNGGITSTDDPLAIAGRTIVAKILAQLDALISSKGTKNKLSLILGSYDKFLALFSLLSLTDADISFFTIPNYAATMSFELVSYDSPLKKEIFPTEESLYVRFLFRNGTDSAGVLTYPLFGRTNGTTVMPWVEFKTHMESVSIEGVEEWCQYCESTADFCKQYTSHRLNSQAIASDSKKLGVTEAGVVGAVCALVAMSVTTIAVAVWLHRRRDQQALERKRIGNDEIEATAAPRK